MQHLKNSKNLKFYWYFKTKIIINLYGISMNVKRDHGNFILHNLSL